MAIREYLENKGKGKCLTSSYTENVNSSKQSNSVNKSDHDIAEIYKEFSDRLIAIAKKYKRHKQYQYLSQLCEIRIKTWQE